MPTRISGLKLQYRFLRLVVAICTYIVLRLNLLNRFLQRISKLPIPKIFQFIALLLTFPCFKITYFFFKIAYPINQRHLLVNQRHLLALSLECARLRGNDSGQQFTPLALPKGSIMDVYKRLGDIRDILDARNKAFHGD